MYLHRLITVVTRAEIGFIFKFPVHYVGAVRFEPPMFLLLLYVELEKNCVILK